MKLKNAVKVLLSCALAGALFTGCGGSTGGDKPADKPAEGGQIKLGMITHLNATEKKMEEILQMVQEESGVPLNKYAITFYDSLKTLQMGIESGSIDEISTYKCVGDYLIAQNDRFMHVENKTLGMLSDSFCFAVRQGDSELKADLDKAIDAMKSDGTLDKLITEYITDVNKKNIPAIEIPHFDGADTIKVGVTGDLPPLDYVSADGKPAGFNTAIIAEIAKYLNKNIELVDIDSGARATALASKSIDVIFWVVVPNSDKMPQDIDKPEGVELTVPYFKENVEHLQLKK